MKKPFISFLVSFVIVFVGSYLGYQMFSSTKEVSQSSESSAPTTPAAPTGEPSAAPTENKDTPAPAPTATAATGEIFSKVGCIACHSISALDVKGGATGPDLSKAYVNVADKHGKSLEEFLKKPSSAVMSSVIGAKPLTDEERKQVIEALRIASEK